MKDIQITMEDDTWMEKTGGYAKDMTLRDYFAAKAMQALIHKNYFDVAAKEAYKMADAMLKARKA